MVWCVGVGVCVDHNNEQWIPYCKRVLILSNFSESVINVN